jgi:glycosyltransferase involved in cell wall biosynthesis
MQDGSARVNAASTLKTAIVHHWLVTTRGAEKVFAVLANLFPQADLFTLVCHEPRMRPLLGERPIRTSLLQFLPRAETWYPYYLPFYPMATERLDLSGYSLVISSDAATVKGVRTDPGALHICYCHTPMRYVWSGYESYRRAAGALGRLVYPTVAARLRRWDFRAAQSVTHFIANSHNVAQRIRRYYARDSIVVYPPVDTDYFHPDSAQAPGEFFLAVSSHVPYKRLDLAIEAFNRNGKPLVVIGDGRERRRLERNALANIRFLGSQPAAVVRQAMQTCRALVFPGEEDFGMVMAEAQACGRPIVAFARGGALEVVSDGVSGILFEKQTADSLCDALTLCEKMRFDSLAMRASALRFNVKRFRREFLEFVERAVESTFSPKRACVDHPTSEGRA